MGNLIILGVISTGVGSTGTQNERDIASLISQVNGLIVLVVILCFLLLIVGFLAILFGMKFFKLYYREEGKEQSQSKQ